MPLNFDKPFYKNYFSLVLLYWLALAQFSFYLFELYFASGRMMPHRVLTSAPDFFSTIGIFLFLSILPVIIIYKMLTIEGDEKMGKIGRVGIVIFYIMFLVGYFTAEMATIYYLAHNLIS